MNRVFQIRNRWFIVASLSIAAISLLLVIFSFFSPVGADTKGPNERLVTVHDRGKETVILTSAQTVQDALAEAKVNLDVHDIVEPAIDTTLVATDYTVNIYRARPVMIVDGDSRQKIMTPYQTAEQIASDANIKLQDEDEINLKPFSDNTLALDAVDQLKINRSIKFTLVLYGKKSVAYTQARTVAGMLASKNIHLGKNDTLSVKESQAMKSGMKVEIWRDGKQTVTKERPVEFDVRQIQDADREVGYKSIKTPGVPGKEEVVYEVTMRNGKEIDRKEIQSVVVKKPRTQVEIVGAKQPKAEEISGGFAEALAKLRSCEGGYESWNPAGPYYGAYQFDQQTWNSVSNAPYGKATPAQQDAAARALYEQRGWSPWPVCGAGLPDTYR